LLGESAYHRLGAPLVSMLARPYQYVSPYVERADSMGDATLSKLDARFPAVKKPTGELYQNARHLVLQSHVADVYGDQYSKIGGEGLPTAAKSAVTTALIVSGEAINWLLGFLRRGAEESKTRASEVGVEATEKTKEKTAESKEKVQQHADRNGM